MRNKMYILLFLSCIYNLSYSQTLDETIKYIKERYSKSSGFYVTVSVDIDEYGNLEFLNKDVTGVTQLFKFNIKDTKVTKALEKQGNTSNFSYELIFTCSKGSCISFVGQVKNEKPNYDNFKDTFFLISNEKDLDRLLKAFNHLKVVVKKDKFD